MKDIKKAEAKLKFLENLTDDEAFALRENLSSVLEEGENGIFSVTHSRRSGNNWNSIVDGIRSINGKIYVELTYFYSNTDASELVLADEFFDKRGYIGHFEHTIVTYTKADLANALKTIVRDYIYKKHIECDDIMREKLIFSLTDWSLINPILDEYYINNNLKYYNFSRYTRDCDIISYEAYHGGEKYLRNYIRENCFELDNKRAELKEIYRAVFYEGVKLFKKTFDVESYRRKYSAAW